MGEKPSALLIGNKGALPFVYPPTLTDRIGECVEWALPLERTMAVNAETVVAADLPGDIEVIFTTWGMPRLDAALLDRLPSLKAVFYAAGSVKAFVTDETWKRGVRVFSAAHANAVPVAEFTVAQIILGLKQALRLRIRDYTDWTAREPTRTTLRGSYRSRIGLISYGSIARLVRRHLRSFGHEVWVFDPFMDEEKAHAENVRLARLEEIFRECDAVSLHTPLLPATTGLIRGEHFLSMKPEAVFINTARGPVIRESEMIEALQQRPDLNVVLDVLESEPPSEPSPLFELPNVWVTPHIAGSMGYECERMGAYIFDAFQKMLIGEPSDLEILEAHLGQIA